MAVLASYDACVMEALHHDHAAPRPSTASVGSPMCPGRYALSPKSGVETAVRIRK